MLACTLIRYYTPTYIRVDITKQCKVAATEQKLTEAALYYAQDSAGCRYPFEHFQALCVCV